MHRYLYEGQVKEFDQIINPKWTGMTIAATEKKAKSNLAYQFKLETHKTANSKIILPGKLEIID